MKFWHLHLIALIFLLQNCSINPPINIFGSKVQLDKITLPEGFQIEVYANDVKDARSMVLSPNGTLFVGTRGAGNVYALQDTDGDFRVDKRYTIAEDLDSPNGVAWKDGDLYVAEISRILRFSDIENKLENAPEPEVVFDGYPDEEQHGWKYIAFGPDEKLYVPVGAPCNICKSEEEIFSSITRLDVATKNMEVVQHGIRNTVGFDWHPETGELWFTENGRDWLDDNRPPDELNRAPQEDMHFGFPYCHGGDILDPELAAGRLCSEFTPPVQKLGPHVAALGMEFITSDMFPEDYQGDVLIAEHGSWNRDEKIGYRIMRVTLDENQNATGYEPFAEGWLTPDKNNVWGRPVDLEFLPDGSLLVSDDYGDAIYRIYRE